MDSNLTEEAFEEERKRRQRSRSIAIAWVIVVLVILFYVATIVRLGGNVLNKPNLLQKPKVPTILLKPKQGAE